MGVGAWSGLSWTLGDGVTCDGRPTSGVESVALRDGRLCEDDDDRREGWNVSGWRRDDESLSPLRLGLLSRSRKLSLKAVRESSRILGKEDRRWRSWRNASASVPSLTTNATGSDHFTWRRGRDLERRRDCSLRRKL